MQLYGTSLLPSGEAEASAEQCIQGVCGHRWRMKTPRNVQHGNGESDSGPWCRYLAWQQVTILIFVGPSPAERKFGDIFIYPFFHFDLGITLPHNRSASKGRENE